jgi:hypothetical protein
MGALMTNNGKGVWEKNDVEMNLMFTAIAMFPTLEHASVYLKTEQNLLASPAKMEVLMRRFPEQAQEAAERVAPLREAQLTQGMLNNADLANRVEMLAIQTTEQFLQEGRVADPSRVARDLADVKAKNIERRLALQGRPTTINENRDVGDILRALAALAPGSVNYDADASSEEE